jgi:hypothetical protein
MKAKIMVGFAAIASMALMLAGSVNTASADTACRDFCRDRPEIRYDVRNIHRDRVEFRRDQRQIVRLDHRCDR